MLEQLISFIISTISRNEYAVLCKGDSIDPPKEGCMFP